MNAAPTASAESSWPWHRWALLIGLAFAAHVGFIFVFGDRQPLVRRATVNAPALQFTTHPTERQQLEDPTLFALPHPNGFAGAAWMRRPQIKFAPYRWTEPPRPLALAVAQLGATFQERKGAPPPARLELEIMPSPELTQLPLPELKFITTRVSTPSLSGALAQRQWLNAPTNLPPWPAADWLTNSIVQVWIEPDGQILSPALLLPGSGSKEADQLALKLARAARFAPLPKGDVKVTRGALIFEWHTVPLTNATLTVP